MGANRKIAKMLRDMAADDTVEIRCRWAPVRRAAALAHTAEQYGFHYGDARKTGLNDRTVAVVLHRDESPAARELAARTCAEYPQAGNGGPVPGLRPGGFAPLPEAKDAVELLQARIRFDLTGKKTEKGLLMGLAGLLAAVALKAGLTGASLIVTLVTLGLLAAGFPVGFALTRRRNKRLGALLHAAGFVPVRDENGRTRYLPPGRQLPGHANPFAATPQPATGANPFAAS